MSATANITSTKELGSLKPIALTPLPDQPLVSILVSNYNYASYLRDSIESVLGQTYQNLELIICDDGSNDSSREILELYKSRDFRIKTVYQANGGQSLALNAAFSVSSGEIICLLDADDVFFPTKVRQVVDAFVAAPESGFAVHRMLFVDRARKYLGDVPCLYDLPSGWQAPSLNLSAPQVLPGMPPTSGLSLHRSAAEVIFPLPAALKAFSDTVIQVVAPLVTPIVAIRAPLSEYRFHGANIGGGRFTESKLDNILLYEKEIWGAWHCHLDRLYSLVSCDLTIAAQRAPSVMDYAWARFRSDDNSKGTYRAIPRASLESLPRHLRWYWRIAKMLPDWLFRRSFDLVYGRTWTKMIVRRILDTCWNGPWPRARIRNSCAGR